MSYKAFVQKMIEHNKTLKQELENPFYGMLLALSENLIKISQVAYEAINLELSKKLLQSKWDEMIRILEEIEETFGWVIDQPYEKLVMKHIFESFEQSLADLDDLIEDINEEIDNNEKVIPYVEAWDIGFFFE